MFTVGTDGPGFDLCQGDDRIRGEPTVAALIATLVAELNRIALANFDGLAVHAGVVGRGGRVIAFPAESGRGKSTLTAASVLSGFDYVSDEALCLDLDTRAVTAYPKPLGLTSWSLARLGIDPAPAATEEGGFVAVDEIGGRLASGPLEIGALVLTDIRPGPAQLSQLSRSEAASTLIRHSFNHYKHPKASFELATAVAARSRAWRLTYDDPHEAVRVLKERLES